MTHTIEIKTPKLGELKGEIKFNGGGAPEMIIHGTNPKIDLLSDEKFHRVERALREFYKYHGGIDKFEVIKK